MCVCLCVIYIDIYIYIYIYIVCVCVYVRVCVSTVSEHIDNCLPTSKIYNLSLQSFITIKSKIQFRPLLSTCTPIFFLGGEEPVNLLTNIEKTFRNDTSYVWRYHKDESRTITDRTKSHRPTSNRRIPRCPAPRHSLIASRDPPTTNYGPS